MGVISFAMDWYQDKIISKKGKRQLGKKIYENINLTTHQMLRTTKIFSYKNLVHQAIASYPEFRVPLRVNE